MCGTGAVVGAHTQGACVVIEAIGATATYRSATERDFACVAGALRAGNITPGNMITHRYRFSEANETFTTWRSKPDSVTKIVLEL